MAWAAVIGAGGAILGGVIASNGAKDAADSQKDASGAAIAEQQRQFDLTRADYRPYRAAGQRALTALEGDVSGLPTSREVMADPGYQFGLDQGQLGLDRKAAASGGRVSGAALKAASQYATSYATTGYNAAYQRRQDRLNRLAALAGVGQTATAGSAAAGANSANAISGILQSQGDASGAASIASGNIWANTTNQLGAIGQRWASGYSNPDTSMSVDYGGSDYRGTVLPDSLRGGGG